jgi:hypothetical protein
LVKVKQVKEGEKLPETVIKTSGTLVVISKKPEFVRTQALMQKYGTIDQICE